jgi:predicted transcriptional regulator
MENHTVESLTAKDVMCENLLLAYEGWTIHRLAEFFINRQISAAPVIASDHELVGVVSVSDVFRFNNLNESDKGAALRNYYRDSCGQEINEVDLRSWVKNADKNCTVHQIMTPEVISVDQDVSVSDVIGVLLNDHIHRVFVTANEKIVGVITAMDVLGIIHKELKSSASLNAAVC